jgi:hypothetical protein
MPETAPDAGRAPSAGAATPGSVSRVRHSPAAGASMPGNAARAGHAAQAGAAPGRLEIVRMFVNTLDIELGTDDLSSPAALTTWLAAHDLLPAAGSQTPDPHGPRSSAASEGPAAMRGAGPADLRRAIALREALRGVLHGHGTTAKARSGQGAAHAMDTGDPIPAPDASGGPAAGLRSAAESLPVCLIVSDDGKVAAAPAGLGPTAALASILLIAAEAAVSGTWSRLKACSADDCRWAFYDRSPTRNGCWCSMAVCGARAKSRAYRQRSAARR